MNVVIMRGIPGSGKSYHAEKLGLKSDSYITVSADYYFEDDDGVYRFRQENQADAHKLCFEDYVIHLKFWPPEDEVDLLIVDNTNIHAWEISPYLKMAELEGVSAKIVQVDCPLEVALKRQTHNVPLETIARMWMTLKSEKLPPWWPVEVVSGWIPEPYQRVRVKSHSRSPGEFWGREGLVGEGRDPDVRHDDQNRLFPVIFSDGSECQQWLEAICLEYISGYKG